MARRGAPNEDLSNIEFETSEDVEVVPTFNSMVSVGKTISHRHSVKRFSTFFTSIVNCRACARNYCGQSMHMVSTIDGK